MPFITLIEAIDKKYQERVIKLQSDLKTATSQEEIKQIQQNIEEIKKEVDFILRPEPRQREYNR